LPVIHPLERLIWNRATIPKITASNEPIQNSHTIPRIMAVTARPDTLFERSEIGEAGRLGDPAGCVLK
jgi:hypothetical protein